VHIFITLTSVRYGRAYRERLYGRWGEVDVQDTCSGVEYLVSMGWVDPDRLVYPLYDKIVLT
jgi:dipeptidyl aminopeptidase/acylaminoacyl peptidase